MTVTQAMDAAVNFGNMPREIMLLGVLALVAFGLGIVLFSVGIVYLLNTLDNKEEVTDMNLRRKRQRRKDSVGRIIAPLGLLLLLVVMYSIVFLFLN